MTVQLIENKELNDVKQCRIMAMLFTADFARFREMVRMKHAISQNDSCTNRIVCKAKRLAVIKK